MREFGGSSFSSLTVTGDLEVSDLTFTPDDGITTSHITTTGSLDIRCTDNMKIGTDGADSVRIGRTNTDACKVFIRSGDDNSLVVTDSKVGIGMEDPSEALEVDGDIQLSPSAISTAHIKTAGSLDVRASANIKIGTDGADSIRIGRTNSSAVKCHIRSGADTDLVVHNSMVGIGTDAPDHTLSVAGDIDLTGGLSFDGGTAVTSIDTDLSSVSASHDSLVSAKAAKAYADSVAGGGDLDATTDSGTIDVTLASETLTVSGGTGISTSATGTTITIAADASQTQITAIGTVTTGVWNATDVAVAHGGTGASSAADARTNLGVAIGSDVQAYDADLAALSSCQTGGAAALAALTSTEIEILDGATVSSAELNTLDAIPRGSILYGNSSAATARLAAGSANQVLTSDGTDIAWADAAGGSAADDESAVLHAITLGF